MVILFSYFIFLLTSFSLIYPTTIIQTDDQPGIIICFKNIREMHLSHIFLEEAIAKTCSDVHILYKLNSGNEITYVFNKPITKMEFYRLGQIFQFRINSYRRRHNM